MHTLLDFNLAQDTVHGQVNAVEKSYLRQTELKWLMGVCLTERVKPMSAQFEF